MKNRFVSARMASRLLTALSTGLSLLSGSVPAAHALPSSVDRIDFAPAPPQPMPPWVRRHWHTNGDESAIVGIGHDAVLASGKHADNVVSILGSAISDGDVTNAVVSVLGETHVSGTVGDSAVAVLGDNYVDGKVNRDVVAVMGDVELGPHAEVSGQTVSIGGVIKVDPAAIVHGGLHNVSLFGGHMLALRWLRTWVTHCLLFGRLLAFTPDLAWAWIAALVALVFYALTALLFADGVHRCADTLEAHPGKSLLAALLTKLATPVIIVLLCVSVIGIIAVPFVGFALLIAALFGKVVMLAWVGRRLVGSSISDRRIQAGVAVLVGGAIAMLLYTVPIVGMMVYALLGFIGLGVVVYTLLLALQSRREAAPPSAAAAAFGVPGSAELAAAGVAANASGHATVAPSVGPAAQAGPDHGRRVPASPAQVPPAASAAMHPHAGFWIRMGALFIDVILMGVVLHMIEHHSGRSHLVLLAAYGALMWKLRGATIGGIICHLQVVRVDGREIDWATAIVRALGCFLSLLVAGLGFIWIAIDPNRQAWHDKIAGTVVVRVPRSTPLV